MAHNLQDGRRVLNILKYLSTRDGGFIFKFSIWYLSSRLVDLYFVKQGNVPLRLLLTNISTWLDAFHRQW